MQWPRWAGASGAVVWLLVACNAEPKPRAAPFIKVELGVPAAAGTPSPDAGVVPAGLRAPVRRREPAASTKPASTGPAAESATPLSGEGTLGLGSSGGYGFSGRGLGMMGTGRGGGGIARPSTRNAFGPAAFTGSQSFNTERYAHASENVFEQVRDAPLSTFSSTVDTAAYANVRRFLRAGQLPPVDAVRIEELVNYFQYDDASPADGPIAISTEVAAAPWNAAHRLLRIGLRTAPLDRARAPASNLVFLIDVSGSMASEDKLPLLLRGLGMLARNLRAQDRVAIVTYAGAAGVALPSTSGRDGTRISAALEQLQAGGSTNGAGGIQRAYELARQSFIRGGNNRVILATDGDFNVGVTSEGELTRLIERERAHGVFLSVLGFGRGNLNDSTMHMLAKHGNGNYAYVDSLAEAHKVLVSEAGCTLVTVAQDVKLQLEWNPTRVLSYRLIGYDDRVLAARDFNDDKKDAGELGAGHSMTALYELVPAPPQSVPGAVDPLRYQAERTLSAAADSDELLTLKLRYKQPGGSQSQLLSHAVHEPSPAGEPSQNLRWSAAVACFGMLLRSSADKGGCSYAQAAQLARAAVGDDAGGERHELVSLIEQARQLAR